MFIDSEANQDISSFSDENFLNHPGFIGGLGDIIRDVVSPAAQEEDRYQKELAAQKANCDYAAGDSCSELNDCSSFFQNIYNSNTGNDRVPKRKRKASNYHRTKVNQYMNARDCDGSTSAIDNAQEDVVVANEQIQESNEEAIKAAADARDAIKKAADAATKALKDAADTMKSSNSKSEATIKGLSDKLKKEKQALEDKNKMMMYGGIAAVGILMVLILRK
jgi:hypothetical protein